VGVQQQPGSRGGCRAAWRGRLGECACRPMRQGGGQRVPHACPGLCPAHLQRLGQLRVDEGVEQDERLVQVPHKNHLPLGGVWRYAAGGVRIGMGGIGALGCRLARPPPGWCIWLHQCRLWRTGGVGRPNQPGRHQSDTHSHPRNSAAHGTMDGVVTASQGTYAPAGLAAQELPGVSSDNDRQSEQPEQRSTALQTSWLHCAGAPPSGTSWLTPRSLVFSGAGVRTSV